MKQVPQIVTTAIDLARRKAQNAGKTGVLLINLGTPEAPSYWPMRRYLKEFLSDRRVIEINRVLWWFLLNVIILTKRPFSSGEAYRSIWNNELNESPLKTITRSQADKLAAALADGVQEGEPKGVAECEIDWAMRYGQPAIATRIKALKDKGCDRILLFPLYPQYSASTTATANDAAFEALKAMRWQPTIRIVPPYYNDPAHIEALAASLTSGLAALDFEPEVILASFHGVPVSYVIKGDPYPAHCIDTVTALRKATGMGADRLKLTFQSRFGSEEWLQPYTDETVAGLARSGVKKLAVITPGFAADCVETLEEIAQEARDEFLENGGEKFALIPCLNDSGPGIDMLAAIVRRELSGWV